MIASFITTDRSEALNILVISFSDSNCSSVISLSVLPTFAFNMAFLASHSGKVISILFSNRRLIAGSMFSGKLVAPSMSTFLLSLSTPCIYTKNSVLTLFDDSFSPSCPLAEHNESISSMKTTDDSSYLAISNSALTSLSDSPTYLEIRSDDDTAKNVDLHSAASAFAMKVFPVPGTPYSRIAFHGSRFPTKRCGISFGNITASVSAYLALSRPATSLNVMFGIVLTIHYAIAESSSLFS